MLRTLTVTTATGGNRTLDLPPSRTDADTRWHADVYDRNAGGTITQLEQVLISIDGALAVTLGNTTTLNGRSVRTLTITDGDGARSYLLPVSGSLTVVAVAKNGAGNPVGV